MNLVAASRDGALSDGMKGSIANFEVPASLSDLVHEVEPDVVINAAAYTAVDRAESEPELAFRINAEAPRALAEACTRHDSLLVHYSTDYVFSGRGERPYREDDPADPLGVYGASKLAGEEAIRETGCRHVILRTAWVYAAHGHNFLRTMLRLGAERDVLRVVSDQVGTPTSARLIARTTMDLLRRASDQSRTLHLTAGGQTTWHGFAEAIFAGAVECGLLAKAPCVEAIATNDYPTPAARPAYSVLDNAELVSLLGRPPDDWQNGLEQVLGEPALRQ